MNAIPAAAAVPDNNPVGIAQNGPIMENTPSTATLIARIAGPTEVEYAAPVSARAPAKAGIAVCHRRSPERSECKPTATIATAAATYGIADSMPTAKLLTPDKLRISVGSHRLTPYETVFNPKYTSANIQIRPLRKAANAPTPPVISARSRRSVSTSQSRSSCGSQRASSGRSTRYTRTTPPSSTAGIPSIRNIHCHPAIPDARWRPRSAPDNGPPTTPDNGAAATNRATVPPRARAPNQFLR